MTPLQIGICLHYHSMVDDDPWLESGAAIVAETFRAFVQNGLLEETMGPKAKRRFDPTPRLHAYISLLCGTPLPEMAWMDPRTKEAINK